MMPHPSEASRVPDTASLIDNHRHRATALHPLHPPASLPGPAAFIKTCYLIALISVSSATEAAALIRKSARTRHHVTSPHSTH